MTPNPSQPGPAPGTAPATEPTSDPAERAQGADGALLGYGCGLGLCGIATALELLVVAGVLLLRSPQPVLLLLLHALAAFVAAPGLHSLMPPSQQSPRRAGLLFLFALTFFMPLFGTLGMLGGLLAERHYPSLPPPPCIWQSLALSELPHQAGAFTARLEYGDGALSAMLRYCPDPERRLSAVMAVRHLRDANDTEVVRLALTDTADDVRLLAYSILDHKEQAFNARQKDLLRQLDSPTLPADSRTQLEKRMAQTQFEMIELGLCAGEVLDYLLLEARRHIDRALQSDSTDRESLFLLGCIALRQSDLPIAEQAFLHAQVRGMSLEAVLPRLAEIAFRQRRFALVTQYLQAIDPICLRAHPRLSGIAAHWLLEPPK